MNLHKPPAVFRPEIEGLRAIAAILVAVFHIWLGRVSGGVDVFFVVSSFLITTGLLGHIDRWQRVDFALFWGRLLLEGHDRAGRSVRPLSRELGLGLSLGRLPGPA